MRPERDGEPGPAGGSAHLSLASASSCSSLRGLLLELGPGGRARPRVLLSRGETSQDIPDGPEPPAPVRGGTENTAARGSNTRQKRNLEPRRVPRVRRPSGWSRRPPVFSQSAPGAAPILACGRRMAEFDAPAEPPNQTFTKGQAGVSPLRQVGLFFVSESIPAGGPEESPAGPKRSETLPRPERPALPEKW